MAGKRMIQKNICYSDKLSEASDGAETLWIRLITHADDVGRFFANPHTLKDACYPKKNVTPEEIGRRVEELARLGLIKVYEVNCVKYLQIYRFDDFQILRRDIKRRIDFPAQPSLRNVSVTDALQEEKGSKEKLSEGHREFLALSRKLKRKGMGIGRSMTKGTKQ